MMMHEIPIHGMIQRNETTFGTEEYVSDHQGSSVGRRSPLERHRRFIIGDIHGAYDQMLQALDRSGFDATCDTLYCTGDFCDRGPDTVACIRFLMRIPHIKPVIGNHDIWLQNWLAVGEADALWTWYNGGNATVASFLTEQVDENERQEIASWLQEIPYARVEEDCIIVHGGTPDSLTLEDIERAANVMRPRYDDLNNPPSAATLVWDRTYFMSALLYDMENRSMADTSARTGSIHRTTIPSRPLETDRTIFIGHTPVPKVFRSASYHLVNVDTGAGKGGVVTILDMDSNAQWNSD